MAWSVEDGVRKALNILLSSPAEGYPKNRVALGIVARQDGVVLGWRAA
jgi:hypothetical protein